MSKLTPEGLIENIAKSGLVETKKIRAVEKALRARYADDLPDSAERIAAAFRKAGLLTKWHTDKLLVGKYKGFFLQKYKLPVPTFSAR
ncbi:MAG: hypothetical protein AAFP69_17690 [Planctomycetota bacterium]